MNVNKPSLKFLLIPLSTVILVSLTTMSNSTAESAIPNWIKELTKSWSEDKISNDEFAEGVDYMIKNKILKLSEMESLITENQKLKHELNYLQSQLSEYERMSTTEEKLKITVYTNKSKYEPADDIIIFGTVTSLVEGHEVGIVISNSSGKILVIAKISPNNDKSYGFVAKNPIFRQSGDYSVHVYYGGQAYDNTEYSYRPVNT